MDLEISTQSKLRNLGSYRAIRRGSNDQGEVESYHRPKKLGSVTANFWGVANMNLIPEELIVQVLGVGLAWEFAPDPSEGEGDFRRHFS